MMDKKVTRAQLKRVDIPGIVSGLLTEELSINRAGIALLSLSRMVSMSFKWITADINTYLLFGSLSKRTRSALTTHSRKSNTLSILDGNIYIDDEMLKLDDAIRAADTTFMDIEQANDTLLGSIADFSAVELVRGGDTEILDQDSILNKRRKTREDNVTEMNPAVIHAMRYRSENMPGDLKLPDYTDLLQIDSGIIELLGDEARARSKTIEEVRNATLETFADGADFGIQDSLHLADAQQEEYERKDDLFLEGLPTEFIFNEMVEDLSDGQRASYFGLLLEMAAAGTIASSQNGPYLPIHCVKVG